MAPRHDRRADFALQQLDVSEQVMNDVDICNLSGASLADHRDCACMDGIAAVTLCGGDRSQVHWCSAICKKVHIVSRSNTGLFLSDVFVNCFLILFLIIACWDFIPPQCRVSSPPLKWPALCRDGIELVPFWSNEDYSIESLVHSGPPDFEVQATVTQSQYFKIL